MLRNVNCNNILFICKNVYICVSNIKDMFTDTNGNALHGWIITYNTYRKVWTAAPRDKYAELFNDCNCKAEGILCSPSLDHLQDMIINYGN